MQINVANSLIEGGSHDTDLGSPYSHISSVASNLLSANFRWLKLVALIAMVFDHTVVGYLQTKHLSVYESAWRLPGRLSIPIFAFLLAYSYAHFTKNKRQFLIRLWTFAMLSEPLYFLYFGEFGNAFLPLAIGITLLFLRNKFTGQGKEISVAIACWGLVWCFALLTLSFTMITIPAMVFCFYEWNRTEKRRWLAGACLMIILSNRVGFPEVALLMLSISLIIICKRALINLPVIQLNKTLMYWIYPLHLLVLYGVFHVAHV